MNLFYFTKNERETQYHSIMGGYETLDYPLYDGYLYIGMLSMLQYNRPFERHDYAVVQFLGTYMEFAMGAEVRYTNDSALGSLSSIFGSLLESTHVPKREIQKLCKVVGFGDNDRFVCLATIFPTGKLNEFTSYIERVLKRLAIGTMTYRKENVLAAVINITQAERTKDNWLEKLNWDTKEMGLQIGVSDSFGDFQHCEPYYLSARETLLFVDRDSPPGIYYFRDYRIPYMVKTCTGKLLPEMLYSDAFRSLLEYEKNAAVSYIETLKVLLEENLNLSGTARRLYISRNTFLSRYERLCAVLDEDLGDPDVRLGLMLSLKIYET